MAKLKRWHFSDGRPCGWAHWCPACEEKHQYYVDLPTGANHQWTWNGSLTVPDFTPSMNISWGYMIAELAPDTKKYYKDRNIGGRCHYFVREGKQLGKDHAKSYIQYCNDCTHAMKGQTVELPDLPNGE